MRTLLGESGAARGARTIEWLKAELVTAVGELFRGLLRGPQGIALDALSQIIMVCYLLAGRLGYGFSGLDQRVDARLQAHLQAGHDLEQWYGDISRLQRHLRAGRPGEPGGGAGRPV